MDANNSSRKVDRKTTRSVVFLSTFKVNVCQKSHPCLPLIREDHLILLEFRSMF